MFLIVTNVNVYVPGDERSKTNPGHGYPAYTETYQKVEEFTDLNMLQQRVAKLEDRKEKYRVYEAKPLSVSVKVNISLHSPTE